MERLEGNNKNRFNNIGLAVMKMVKRCREESSNMDLAQSGLLGCVVDNCLEITNSFPFPKSGDETMDEEMCQWTMMHRLRRINVGHFHVGWYQSTDVDNLLSMALWESQYHYQTSIEVGTWLLVLEVISSDTSGHSTVQGR